MNRVIAPVNSWALSKRTWMARPLPDAFPFDIKSNLWRLDTSLDYRNSTIRTVENK